MWGVREQMVVSRKDFLGTGSQEVGSCGVIVGFFWQWMASWGDIVLEGLRYY